MIYFSAMKYIFYLLLLLLGNTIFGQQTNYSVVSCLKDDPIRSATLTLYNDTFLFIVRYKNVSYIDAGKYTKEKDKIFFNPFHNKTDSVIKNVTKLECYYSSKPTFDTSYFYIVNSTNIEVNDVKISQDTLNYFSVKTIPPNSKILIALPVKSVIQSIFVKFRGGFTNFQLYEFNVILLESYTSLYTTPLLKEGKISKRLIALDKVKYFEGKIFNLEREK